MYLAAGIQFKVGDVLQEFIDAGFTISTETLEKELEPWGFYDTILMYDSEQKSFPTLNICILNESDISVC